MANIFAVFVAVLLFTSAAYSGSQTIKGGIRSPSGKLLYKTKTDGKVTEISSPSGKLLMRSKTLKGSTEVRSPGGKLLQRMKFK